MRSPSHLDAEGRAQMVAVGSKPTTARRAVAGAQLKTLPSTLELLRSGDAPKRDVLATARLAGIMAAKKTPELIPLCHAIALTRVSVELTLEEDGIAILATAEAQDRTGVEMEALTAASVAALTLYDMLKSVDRGMVIEQIALLEKDGGRSGHWRRKEVAP